MHMRSTAQLAMAANQTTGMLLRSQAVKRDKYATQRKAEITRMLRNAQTAGILQTKLQRSKVANLLGLRTQLIFNS